MSESAGADLDIIGALTGFAVIAIIVGAIGTFVMSVKWSEAPSWSRTTKYKVGFGIFITLLFTGAILVGGLG